jgi:hypothetical protein
VLPLEELGSSDRDSTNNIQTLWAKFKLDVIDYGKHPSRYITNETVRQIRIWKAQLKIVIHDEDMPQNHRSVTIPLAPESGLYARAIGRIPFNLNAAAIEECMTECVATPPKTAPNSGPDDSEMDGENLEIHFEYLLNTLHKAQKLWHMFMNPMDSDEYFVREPQPRSRHQA